MFVVNIEHKLFEKPIIKELTEKLTADQKKHLSRYFKALLTKAIANKYVLPVRKKKKFLCHISKILFQKIENCLKEQSLNLLLLR